MELFLRLLLAHMLGDFAFQSSKLAAMKREGWKGLAIHLGVVAAFTVLLVVGYSPRWWLVALVAILPHLLLDAYRSSLNKSSAWGELVYFLLDQGVHIALLLTVAAVFSGEYPWEWFYPLRQFSGTSRLMFLVIVGIFLLWEVPLLERYVLNLLGRCRKESSRFQVSKVHRFAGGAERLVGVLLAARLTPWAFPLAFLPRLALSSDRACALLRALVSALLTALSVWMLVATGSL